MHTNALANAGLTISEEDGRKVLRFSVTNESQKKWIEEKILRSLEERFCHLADCTKIRLEPVVEPEEQQENRIYMPSEKAEDLMSRNPEVKDLVIDLGLEVK